MATQQHPIDNITGSGVALGACCARSKTSSLLGVVRVFFLALAVVGLLGGLGWAFEQLYRQTQQIAHAAQARLINQRLIKSVHVLATGGQTTLNDWVQGSRLLRENLQAQSQEGAINSLDAASPLALLKQASSMERASQEVLAQQAQLQQLGATLRETARRAQDLRAQGQGYYDACLAEQRADQGGGKQSRVGRAAAQLQQQVSGAQQLLALSERVDQSVHALLGPAFFFSEQAAEGSVAALQLRESLSAFETLLTAQSMAAGAGAKKKGLGKPGLAGSLATTDAASTSANPPAVEPLLNTAQALEALRQSFVSIQLHVADILGHWQQTQTARLAAKTLLTQAESMGQKLQKIQEDVPKDFSPTTLRVWLQRLDLLTLWLIGGSALLLLLSGAATLRARACTRKRLDAEGCDSSNNNTSLAAMTSHSASNDEDGDTQAATLASAPAQAGGGQYLARLRCLAACAAETTQGLQALLAVMRELSVQANLLAVNAALQRMPKSNSNSKSSNAEGLSDSEGHDVQAQARALFAQDVQDLADRLADVERQVAGLVQIAKVDAQEVLSLVAREGR